MKFKSIYLYGIVALIAIVTLIIVSQTSSDEKTNIDITNKEMPRDNVHQNLNNGMMNNPTGGDVADEIKQKIADLKKYVEANPEDTLKMREYADFLAAHNPEEALKYYQKILDLDNNRKDVYFGITFVYYNQGNLEKAEEVTRNMLMQFPNDPMVNYNIGAIEATKGNKDKAREIWTKLIEDYPTDKTAELARSSLNKL